jgi:hypothetical protein
MSSSFLFRQDEVVKINYAKPLSFQATDWRSFDYKRPYDPEEPKGTYRKEFRVQMVLPIISIILLSNLNFLVFQVLININVS